MEISQHYIQLVNPFLLILTVFLIFVGYRKGFLSKVLSLFSFAVIVIAAYYLSPILAVNFKILPRSWAPYQDGPLNTFFYEQANQWFIFACVVLLASALLFVLKPIILLIGELPIISKLNSLFGCLFGVIESLLFIFVLLIILHTPFITNGKEVIEQTILKPIEQVQIQMFSQLEEVNFDFIQKIDNTTIEKFKKYLETHGISDEQISQFLEGQVNQNE